MSQDVERVDFSQKPLKVYSEGREYLAKAVIISTGASARFLGLDSEKRLMNRGVSACATCDGALPLFRDQELVVVGGGDSAMEEATYLTRFASKVWIVHRRNQFRASKIMVERAKSNPKIEFILNTVVDEVLGDDQVTGVRLRNVKKAESWDKPIAGLFLAIGHQPNTEVFRGQLELDDTGYIKTRGRTTYTSIEGVFAAGDVQDHVYRQAVTAAGSGCQAAIDAERWLEAHEH